MFGFPQSLPTKEREEGVDSEQVMLPPSLSSDYETPKSSNGVVHNHEAANGATCCQQLRGECVEGCITHVLFMFKHLKQIHTWHIVMNLFYMYIYF